MHMIATEQCEHCAVTCRHSFQHKLASYYTEELTNSVQCDKTTNSCGEAAMLRLCRTLGLMTLHNWWKCCMSAPQVIHSQLCICPLFKNNPACGVWLPAVLDVLWKQGLHTTYLTVPCMEIQLPANNQEAETLACGSMASPLPLLFSGETKHRLTRSEFDGLCRMLYIKLRFVTDHQGKHHGAAVFLGSYHYDPKQWCKQPL